MTKEEKVCQERGSQYGSFSRNMELVGFIKSYFIHNVTDGFYGNDYKEIDLKNRILLSSTLDFSYTLMALKAVRSLTAVGDVYDDCIIDFLNYKKLSEEVIQKIPYISEMLQNTSLFRFDERIFNPILNRAKQPAAEQVKWLVANDKLAYEYSIFCDQYEYVGYEYRQSLIR